MIEIREPGQLHSDERETCAGCRAPATHYRIREEKDRLVETYYCREGFEESAP